MKKEKKFKIKKYCFAPISMVLKFYKSADIETTHPDIRAVEIRMIDEVNEKMKKHSSDLTSPEIKIIYDAFHYLQRCLDREISFDRESSEYDAISFHFTDVIDTMSEISPLFIQAGITSPKKTSENVNKKPIEVTSVTVSIDELLESLQNSKNNSLEYVTISFLESQTDGDDIIPASLHLSAFSADANPFVEDDIVDGIALDE